MSVLITGASSGIGQSCAFAFAAAGHELILIARRQERLQELAKKISQAHSVPVHPVTLDVRNHIALDQAISENQALYNGVKILVNNAGLAKGLSPLQEGNPEDWDTMIDTNIKGLLYMTRAILPRMLENQEGHIINIGSIAGHWVYEKGNVYCATKFAVRALTEGLRYDVKGTPIRVTEISPGMVETEFSEVRYGSREKGAAVYSGRKALQPNDIAETVLWCTSRPAHVNVQELVIYPTEQPGVHGSAR